MSVQILSPFLKVIFLIEFWEFLIYSEYKFFVSYIMRKTFFLLVACLFILLTVSFKEQKFLILMKFNLWIFYIDCDFGFVGKNFT